MHRENLIIVAVCLALCLPFLRMLATAPVFWTLPVVIVPHR